MTDIPVPGEPFASEFFIDALPEDDINYGTFRITVTYMGRGLWAVTQGPFSYNRDGTETEMTRASWKADDEPAFLAKWRMPLEEAMDLATQILPRLSINGRTFAQWQEFHGK